MYFVYSRASLCKLPAPDLELFQVRPLHVDHGRQQLVLQPIARDGEVDEGALRLQLGLEMRVCQLRVEDEAESGVEIALLVPNLNVPEIRPKGSRSVCLFQVVSLQQKRWDQYMTSTSVGLP